MAVSGTPYEGLDDVIGPAVYVSGSLDLRLYTNTADSLGVATVLADLTFPSGAGYATYTLSGTWAFSNGVVTYDDGSPDNPQFTAGAGGWTGDVVGAAITDGTYLLHFKDFDNGPYTVSEGQVIEVDISSLVA